MYRLLILDDEPYIADSLYNYFQNIEHLELDLYREYLPVKALEKLNSMKFDIVITDIRMPGMDGIDLMKIIKNNWPHCQVIFLTGYDEFEYVYTAIKHKGVKYILKCESRSEILRAVEEAVKELDDRVNMEEILAKANKQNEAVLPYLRQELIIDLINGSLLPNAGVKDLFSELGVPLDPDQPLMLVMVYIHKTTEISSVIHRTNLHNSIRIIAEKFLCPVFNLLQVACEPSVLLWLVQPSSDILFDKSGDSCRIDWDKAKILLNGILESIQNMYAEKLNIYTSFVFDTQEKAIDSVQKRYNILKQMLDCSIGTEPEMLIINSEKLTLERMQLQNCSHNLFPMDVNKIMISKLENVLEKGQREDVLQLLSRLTKDLRKCNSLHYYPALESYFKIAFVLLSYINRHNLTDKLAFKLPMDKLMSIEQHDSWEGTVEYLEELVNAILDIRDRNTGDKMVQVINKVMQYINDNISEDLSLIQLSEIVFYNPSYLSRIFKKVTGQNLSTYINQVRIEKAKELLKTTKYKVNEIALKVGCTSSSYFTQFFSREVGISPHQYREDHVQN